MIRIGVELGARRYDVGIGAFEPDAAAAAIAAALPDATGLALLADGGLLSAAGPRVEALARALRARLPALGRRDLPAGEPCKTLAEIERSAGWMAGSGFDRGAAVLGIGGGAACDHAGFLAAIYLRGVRFALCPTTLLAMLDASVGGKTAVDLPGGKNLVGAFHQPRAVVADLGWLDTLPGRDRAAGFAEAVKCGLIADPDLLDRLERRDRLRDPAELAAVVAACVRVKAAVVAEDERESGRRAILNFGHTLGHALEAASGYGLRHGEAVSLGMVAALAFGESRGVTPPGLRRRIEAILGGLGLPVDYRARLDEATLARVGVDKKRRGGRLRFVLCPAAGRADLVDISPSDLRILL